MDQSPSDSTCSSSCVKLYLCSNPEDSVMERRALRDTVFPKLREHCKKTLGLDVRVIDPFESSDASRWPDDYTRQQLIKECRESSAGPFFLALVGHQYGTASLPVWVEVLEYQLLLWESQRVGISTQQLERVYQRDENTNPSSYYLRPQAEVTEEEQSKAKAEEELREVFHTTVSLCVRNGLMAPERAHSYYRSALDTDLRFALDDCPDKDTVRRCLVYVHKVVNAKGEREKGQIDSQLQPESEAAASDLGTAPTEEELLSELRDGFLRGLITSRGLLVYTMTTECDPRHGYTTARRRGYAESLCQQVYSDLLRMTDSLNSVDTSEDPQVCNTLVRELAEQEELCDTLSRFYDVIRKEEEEIRAYLEHSEEHRPLVVTGGPCTGKAVLLAHCAQQIKSWLSDSDPVVVTYFCNLQHVLYPKHLLSSLCHQITSRYHSNSNSKQGTSFYHGFGRSDSKSGTGQAPTLDSHHHEATTTEHDSNLNLSATQCPDLRGLEGAITKPDISLSELTERLSSLLSLLPSPKQPLVLILNGLDQIENNLVCPQIIDCLPSPLPPDVKLILAASSNRTHVLQAVEQRFPGCSGGEREPGYVCVPLGPPDRKECAKLLASLLSSSGRRVTSGQQALVNQALTSCCLTLYARLLHVHTSLWRSDSDVTEASLPDGVHGSISALLDHLEWKHGSLVVARTVSYLTLSRTGLTEAELVDLLSSDDEVLSECVQRSGSPSSNMRVQQVDVERLLLDLRGFLIRRKLAGSCVVSWASRHFKLVVARRYLGTHEEKGRIHSEMADYFSGRWAGGNAKPLLVNHKSGPDNDAAEVKIYIDRQPCSQPFVFSSSSSDAGRVNVRKVVELPYHFQQSGRWEELEHCLLMSSGFQQAMVRAGLLGDLVTMLECDKGSSLCLFLRESLLLTSILKSSACLLQPAPLQLPTVMETNLLPYLEVFPALEGYITEIRQQRRKGESRLRVVLCPAPSCVPPIRRLKSNDKVRGVSVAEAVGTECGIVVEIMDDGSAWIWNGSGCDVVKLSLSHEQKELKFSGVKSSGRFMLLSTRCNKLFLWDVTAPEMFLEVKDPLKTEFKSNLSQQTPNKIEGVAQCQEKLFMWWKDEGFVSMFNIASEIMTHFQCESAVTSLVCSPDGFYMYCGQEEGTVSIFDTDSGNLLGKCTNSSHNAVASIIICEVKEEMACVDETGNVTVWDVVTKRQPPTLVKERLTEDKSNKILNTEHAEKNGMLLVCQSHQVTLWDMCDWELWDQFLAPQGRAFTQALLSPNGHLFLALLDTCALVLVWSVSTGECVLSLEANQQPGTLLKTASDVISVSQDGCLTVWDSEMIDAAGTAPKTGRGVREVVIEQTGERFYTSDGSETVWRWSLETGFPDATLKHDGPVEKILLSPDNIHLVTLSAGEIYVWRTELGQNILRISGSRATDILITPNSNFGVSISKQGLSRVWKLANGSIVCSIHPYLSNAKVSPESTFLIGCRHGDLLAASLWSGSISKRFSCMDSSEHVIAFHTLSQHPDFVVVMCASRAVYTWKVAEETLCMHLELPCTFQCQPQDFQMSADGSYALLSTDNDTISLLDLSQVRLCSFKTKGPVVKASLDKSGCFVAYISVETTCACDLHTRPVLTVVRLTDGERVGSVCLPKTPSTLLVHKQQRVFVGFEDGSVGVYSVSDDTTGREESLRCRENLTGESKQCPFDRAPISWLPLVTPIIAWP